VFVFAYFFNRESGWKYVQSIVDLVKRVLSVCGIIPIFSSKKKMASSIFEDTIFFLSNSSQNFHSLS